ncbi:hypothetical protein OH77DRAFT_1022617 [Trametes cingulata]|nr:hypothetical protein OH77DRAFT_1022617 [Trametes cingulata]
MSAAAPGQPTSRSLMLAAPSRRVAAAGPNGDHFVVSVSWIGHASKLTAASAPLNKQARLPHEPPGTWLRSGSIASRQHDYGRSDYDSSVFLPAPTQRFMVRVYLLIIDLRSSTEPRLSKCATRSPPVVHKRLHQGLYFLLVFLAPSVLSGGPSARCSTLDSIVPRRLGPAGFSAADQLWDSLSWTVAF